MDTVNECTRFRVLTFTTLVTALGLLLNFHPLADKASGAEGLVLPSRLWKWPVAVYNYPNEQANENIKVTFSDTGLLERLYFDPQASGNFDDATRLVDSSHTSITIAGQAFGDSNNVVLSQGYDLFRDHFKRKFSISKFSQSGKASDALLTNYGELINRSEIFYLWPRIHFLNDIPDFSQIRYSFGLSNRFDRVYFFEKVGGDLDFKSQPLGPTEFSVPVNHEKPYIIFFDSATGIGLTFLPPLSRPELRNWDEDDYIVYGSPDLTTNINKGEGKVTVSFTIKPNGGVAVNDSIDFYFTLRPFSGPPETGYTLFEADSAPRGITNLRGPFSGNSSQLRYYPIEGYSTDTPKQGLTSVRNGAFYWGHAGGTFHSWGYYKIIPNFIKFRNQVWQDETERLLEVYLEKSKDTGPPSGVPPYKLLTSHLLDEIISGADPYEYFYFSLSSDVGTRLAADLFPYFKRKDRREIFDELNRLQELYKEDGLYSWTKRLGAGGSNALWFNYSSHRVWRQYPPNRDVSVINTHVLATKTAAQMMFLAQTLGREDDVAFWKNMTEGGIDGIIWYLEQPDAWSEGNTALNYNLGGSKIVSYENIVTNALPYISILSPYRISDLTPWITRLFNNTLGRENFNAPISLAYVYGGPLRLATVRDAAEASSGGLSTILPLHPAPLFKFSDSQVKFWQIDDDVFTFKKNTGNEYFRELSVSLDEEAAELRGKTVSVNHIKSYFGNERFYSTGETFQLRVPTGPFEIYELVSTDVLELPVNPATGWNRFGVSGNYSASGVLEGIDNNCGSGVAGAISRRVNGLWETFTPIFGGSNFTPSESVPSYIRAASNCTSNP